MRTGVGLASIAVLVGSVAVRAQRPTAPKKPKVQVEIVKTLGCVEKRAGDPATWWLTRASEPEVVGGGVFNANQVEKAKGEALGTGELQLIGVADFLDAESLLQWGERARFTKPEQVNATGELREGRTVLVKGLLIEAEPESRVNLLAVVGLAEDCG